MCHSHRYPTLPPRPIHAFTALYESCHSLYTSGPCCSTASRFGSRPRCSVAELRCSDPRRRPIVSNRDQSLPPPCCKTLPAQIAAMPNSSFAYQCLSACSPCRTCPIVTSRICCCTLLVRSAQINCSTNPLYALPGPCLSNPNHSESASAILFRRRSFRHLSTAVLAKSFAMP